jgi:hypothetical protein
MFSLTNSGICVSAQMDRPSGPTNAEQVASALPSRANQNLQTIFLFFFPLGSPLMKAMKRVSHLKLKDDVQLDLLFMTSCCLYGPRILATNTSYLITAQYFTEPDVSIICTRGCKQEGPGCHGDPPRTAPSPAAASLLPARPAIIPTNRRSPNVEVKQIPVTVTSAKP